MAVSMRTDFDMSMWSERLKESIARAENLSPVHEDVGELLLHEVQDNFDRQGAPVERWPELADSTLLARARGRSGHGQVTYKRKKAADGAPAVTPRAAKAILGAKALIWSGRLLRSLTYVFGATFVDVGSNLIYAARQFFGSAAGVRPVTPARNPFGLTDEIKEEVRRKYAWHLFGPLTGGGG